MQEYEFRFRFATEAEPRATFEEKAILKGLRPFLFPGKGDVVYVGSSVERIDRPQRSEQERQRH